MRCTSIVSDAPSDLSARQKRAVARAAISEVGSGMIVGLGTGSTAAMAIEALAERVRDGLIVQAVPTSRATEAALRAASVEVAADELWIKVDLAIDGVDEIDTRFRAIKGAGGAMLREKIVARSAGRMIAIADSSKAVAALSGVVPVEATAFGIAWIAGAIAALGAETMLRRDNDEQPVFTDQGNPILDCRFGTIADAERLAVELQAIPGIIGHGLFIGEINALYLSDSKGRAVLYERTSGPAEFAPRDAAQGERT